MALANATSKDQDTAFTIMDLLSDVIVLWKRIGRSFCNMFNDCYGRHLVCSGEIVTVCSILGRLPCSNFELALVRVAFVIVCRIK